MELVKTSRGGVGSGDAKAKSTRPRTPPIEVSNVLNGRLKFRRQAVIRNHGENDERQGGGVLPVCIICVTVPDICLIPNHQYHRGRGPPHEAYLSLEI